jgi:uncharacterized protein
MRSPQLGYDGKTDELWEVIMPVHNADLLVAPKTLAEIQAVLWDLKAKLTDYYRVVAIGIFGSYARNEQRGDSDVDILIDYVKAPSLIRLIELRDDLSDRLGMKVDVVTVNGLRAEIKHDVLSDVIYLWNVEE